MHAYTCIYIWEIKKNQIQDNNDLPCVTKKRYEKFIKIVLFYFIETFPNELNNCEVETMNKRVTIYLISYFVEPTVRFSFKL
jgi:hypothetical protein